MIIMTITLRRKVYRGNKAGIPVIALGKMFRDWIGREVIIEIVNKTTIIVKLVEDDRNGEKKEE